MVTVTKELQATLQSAVADARRRRHEYVTLEHLLHAMARGQDRLRDPGRLRRRHRRAGEGARGLPRPDARGPRPGAGSRSRPPPSSACCSAPPGTCRAPGAPSSTPATCWWPSPASAAPTPSSSSRSRASAASTSCPTSPTAWPRSKEGPRRRSPARAAGGGRSTRREGPLPRLLHQPGREGRPRGDRPAHRPAPRDRAHRPGPLPAPQEQPDLRRRPRRRQDRHRRGAGAAHPREERSPRCSTKATRLRRSTWAPCSPAPSSAASSRSGSRGSSPGVKKIPHAILFIDEIHTIVGAGATTGGSMDASNLLKPALASGELRCIGSTTYEDYKQTFEKDRALARRFQKIEVARAHAGGDGRDPPGPEAGLRGAPRRRLLRRGAAGRRRALGQAHQRPAPPRQGHRRDRRGRRRATACARRTKRRHRSLARDVERVVARMAKIPRAHRVGRRPGRAGRARARAEEGHLRPGQGHRRRSPRPSSSPAPAWARRRSPSAPSSSPAPPASARPSSPSSWPASWGSSSCAST